MFFKKSTKREQANARKAAVSAFIFYLLALGGHALYSYFQDDKPPVTFVILMAFGVRSALRCSRMLNSLRSDARPS
ncbi:hypothetical protein [Bacillus pumilus]|uniref:hypothetical protein n=1 Tax=Bacillus pumilus TaxID=1408 RepID=UPI00333A7151